MSRWDWNIWDTLLTMLAALLVVTWWAALTVEQREPTPVPCIAFARDTVGCGHLTDCTPRTYPRWMSHNPLVELPR